MVDVLINPIRVICIDASNTDSIIDGEIVKRDLSLYKEYKAEPLEGVFSNLYWITLDYIEPAVLFERSRFITIEEFREQKLKILLNG